MRPVSVLVGTAVVAALAAGASLAPASSPPSAGATSPHGVPGYWEVAADGGVFALGSAPFHGSLPGEHITPAAPVVGIAGDAATGGYWLAAADGGVFSFDAPFYGSMGGKHLSAPVVGIAATPTGGGYWLVAADGGIFSFGNAHFYGSMGGKRLDAPVSGMAVTTGGRGYDLVAKNGSVFSFGDAHFYCDGAGSKSFAHFTSPWIGIAIKTAASSDYWVTESDGLTSPSTTTPKFTQPHGTAPTPTPAKPRGTGSCDLYVTHTYFRNVVGIVAGRTTTSVSRGYCLATSNGWVYSADGASCYGPSTTGFKDLAAPLVGIAAASG